MGKALDGKLVLVTGAGGAASVVISRWWRRPKGRRSWSTIWVRH